MMYTDNESEGDHRNEREGNGAERNWRRQEQDTRQDEDKSEARARQDEGKTKERGRKDEGAMQEKKMKRTEDKATEGNTKEKKAAYDYDYEVSIQSILLLQHHGLIT